MIQNWEKIKKDEIYKTAYRKMAKRLYRMPNGKNIYYDILIEKDTVCVLALTKDKKVILAKQFRPGPEKILSELPGGKVEEGETPATAIKKELLEETGYKGKFKFIGKTISDAYSTRTRHHFIALDCIKISEPKNAENEFTELILMDLKSFKKHLKSGKLTDALTAYMGLNHLKLL